MSYQPIENHGIIGDLHTVALVGMDGSIDFMCLPEFDSPSVFAALLDHRRGGRFQLAPLLDGARQKQLYLPGTCVLLTRFLATTGIAEVSDFMPVEDAEGEHNVVRRAKTVRGEVRFRMLCQPRVDYARGSPAAEHTPDGVRFVASGNHPIALHLRASVPLRIEAGAAVAEFTLRADESASFVLEQIRPGEDSPSAAPDYVADAFKRTVNFWRRWLGRSSYQGRWREMVNRSALTLKLLTSRPHGSIVASPTFGLPEELGGQRNWDYRYTWIRDASFTLYGLMRLGFTEEAAAFMRWVEARCEELEPDGSLQIMYGIDGRHRLPEETLPHLGGYMGSSPVRIGNAAYGHLQLDIYGELMDAIYLYDKYGAPLSYDMWSTVERLLDWVVKNWEQPDQSIWEVRGPRQHFTYSKLQCWVALDRGVRLARKRSFPSEGDTWRHERNRIYKTIMQAGWNERRGAFTQAFGSDALDAATLMMPLMLFVSPSDPRMLSTLARVREELAADSLVRRYDTDTAA